MIARNPDKKNICSIREICKICSGADSRISRLVFITPSLASLIQIPDKRVKHVMSPIAEVSYNRRCFGL